jgi:hypothetical protein
MQEDFQERMRLKRQPPSVQFFTMDAVILNNAYDLVEHMQQLKEAIKRGDPTQEDITRLCNSIDYDIDNLRSHLRDIKAETKQMRGGEPLSQQTEIQQRDQVDE